MTVEELRAVGAAVRVAWPGVRLAGDRAVRRRAAATNTGELAAPLFDAEGRPLVVSPRDLVPVDVPAPDALRLYWRELTRARGVALARPRAAGLVEQFRKLGPQILPELRAAFVDDGAVAATAPDAVVVARAVGVLAELAAFDPAGVAVVFPSLAGYDLTELDPVRQTLTEYDALRPEGSADGVARPVPPDRAANAPADGLTRAAEALARSNFARAAVIAAAAPGGLIAARKVLADGLVPALGKALRLSAGERRDWAAALEPVALGAAGRLWGPSGRVLYDLQALAADSGPVTRRGRRVAPGEVPVPVTVSRLRKLHAAAKHLHAAVLIASEAREQIDHLIEVAADREAALLAATAGPTIDESLREAGLGPANEAEEVAHAAMVSRLVAKLGEWGFLRIGDLRDALAQGQVKMPDLAGVGEWLRGDALLRADTLLGARLPGAYWPGEIYLRWIHRATSVAFGTPWGRKAWLYFMLPALAALLGVEFAGYLRIELGHVAGWVARQFGAESPPGLGAPPAHGGLALTPEKIAIITAIAILIALIVNSSRVRAAAGSVGRGLLTVFTAGPRRVWDSRPVTALRDSRVTAALATPAAVSFLVYCALLVWRVPPPARWWVVAAAFVLTAVLVRTGRGRRVELRAWQVAGDAWREVTANLIPGVIGFVLDFFRRAGEFGEKALYAVDEFLRFREGQSAVVSFGKAVSRVVWRPISYVTRFAFTLLIEPQVNPVKHFPVVTVSHKMLLPLIGVLSDAAGISIGTATTLIACVPGIFGFIVWELRANWRLYDATRKPTLEPAVLGHHGETMRRYLRPGFHSGTVPKLFRPLRRAWARARLENRPPPPTPFPDRISAVGDTVRHWADANLVMRLNRTAAWAGEPLAPTAVRVGVQSFRILLARAADRGDPARVAFWLDGEQVAMAVTRPDWLAGPMRETFDMAIRGLAATAGVQGVEVEWGDWVGFWENAKAARGPVRVD